MHWEVEIQPRGADAEAERVLGELSSVGIERPRNLHASRFYLLSGELDETQARRVARELLADETVEDFRLATSGKAVASRIAQTLNVMLKPGVMDPAAQSVERAIADLGLPSPRVRTGRRYRFEPAVTANSLELLAERVLANDAIEQVVVGPLPDSAWGATGAPYQFRLVTIPIRSLDDSGLQKLSKEGQLYLSLTEMQAIREHFRIVGRDATDVELETLAQTWSEHCSHKTLKGKIDYTGPDGLVFYDNLLKQTVFKATQEIRARLGNDDWCVSVFADNAGVVKFDERNHACFKVETHNHPSAIEPYGGANTGLGGVIRDVLGTGLGGQPIANTDVFCFAPPDRPSGSLPRGVLHPRRVMRGVVAGVRDYGNRMGIPTVNGTICFDERYLGNPLVFCGTVGLIPVGKEHKEPRPGDLIVAVGGRTGRDGIHGATFSSAELTHESEQLSGGAVQIGNAITQKKMLDVLLVARDRDLFTAITDCGAGGFSSAIGEMGAEMGAEVHLDRAPLKYEGLSYTEVWISEAQERMILAVPPAKWPEVQKLCLSEDVEATVIGEYQPTGRLRLYYQGNRVADLDMHFLHEGRPPVVRQAVWRAGRNQELERWSQKHGVGHPETESGDQESAGREDSSQRGGGSTLSTQYSVLRTEHARLRSSNSAPSTQDSGLFNHQLLRILAALNVCSKEWVIRQYDHEVQGGSVIKPLVGERNDGPGDAAVVAPVLGSTRGLAIGCGISPRYGDLDPYWMAASAIDEAVRNVVAVGADPGRVAILDNFCWGNTDRPETLGSLVRAAEACRDVAIAYATPFVSGKDSLNNEFHSGDTHLSIPPTLLISALGIVPDIRKCVTMDLKKPGNLLYLLGTTRNELGGSHFHLVEGIQGGNVPQVDLEAAPRLFARLHKAIQRGLVDSCHDLSEGGLAVALAEMCFAGALGAQVEGKLIGTANGSSHDAVVASFSESNSRFLLEIPHHGHVEFERLLDGLPCTCIGKVKEEAELIILGEENEPWIHAPIAALKEAWQQPLRW